MSDSFHHRETHAKLHVRYQLLNKDKGNHDIFFCSKLLEVKARLQGLPVISK